jgi:hypothetical protein
MDHGDVPFRFRGGVIMSGKGDGQESTLYGDDSGQLGNDGQEHQGSPDTGSSKGYWKYHAKLGKIHEDRGHDYGESIFKLVGRDLGMDPWMVAMVVKCIKYHRQTHLVRSGKWRDTKSERFEDSVEDEANYDLLMLEEMEDQGLIG